METRPMTYISQKDIFQFLSLETRRKLASGHPEFRQIHQKRPFSLKTLNFEYEEDQNVWWKYHKITLDGLTWEIRRKEDSDHLKTVTLPSGKKVDVKSEKKICDELVPRFMTNYLGRKGTRIQKFFVKYYTFPIFNIPPMNIRELHLHFYNDIDQNLTTYLANSHFEKVAATCDYPQMLRELKKDKITTDLLMLKVKDMDAATFISTFEISKKSYVLDRLVWPECFIENMKAFREDAEGNRQIGSVYRGNLLIDNRGLLEDHEQGWIELIRGKLEAEYKYFGERNGICLGMFGDRELFVCARKNNLNDLEVEQGENFMHFQAEILKKGTTLFYHELPVALQEKYQPLVAEQTRLMEQPEIDNDNENEEEIQPEENILLHTEKILLFILQIMLAVAFFVPQILVAGSAVNRLICEGFGEWFFTGLLAFTPFFFIDIVVLICVLFGDKMVENE